MLLFCSPPTAKRLLQVINLKAGDVVIQNGANSFVGQASIIPPMPNSSVDESVSSMGSVCKFRLLYPCPGN